MADEPANPTMPMCEVAMTDSETTQHQLNQACKFNGDLFITPFFDMKI